MQLTAVLAPAQEGGFVAINPETGTTTQSETVEEALSNLQEATELYLEESPMEPFGMPAPQPRHLLRGRACRQPTEHPATKMADESTELC